MHIVFFGTQRGSFTSAHSLWLLSWTAADLSSRGCDHEAHKVWNITIWSFNKNLPTLSDLWDSIYLEESKNLERYLSGQIRCLYSQESFLQQTLIKSLYVPDCLLGAGTQGWITKRSSLTSWKACSKKRQTLNKYMKKWTKIISFSNEYFHENKTGSVMMKTDPTGGCLCTQLGWVLRGSYQFSCLFMLNGFDHKGTSWKSCVSTSAWANA